MNALMYRVNNMLINTSLSLSPLDIATEGVGDTYKPAKEFGEMFQLGNLYQLLKRDALIWTTIVVLCLLGSMFFVSRSEKLAEKKKDVYHKLFIAFIICSAVWICSLVDAILSSIF